MFYDYSTSSLLLFDSTAPSNNTQRRYRHLVETSPAPINLFDSTGTTIWGNDAILDLLGLDSRDELIGRSIFEFIIPEDRYTAEQELLTVVERKESTGPTAMRVHRENGETRDIRVSTAPGNFNGKDIGQAIVIDVTPLNEVQEELEEGRQFISKALDTIQDAFYVIDTSGNLVRWNDTLREVVGYDETEIRRMDIEEFFVQSDRQQVSESISAAFSTSEAVFEATVLTKSGQELPYEFRKRRFTKDGHVVGLVGIGRDISDRRARDQHLRAVDRLLQHNLRNQLNIVLGSTQRLREVETYSDSEDIQRIDNAAENLLSIFEHHKDIVGLLTPDSANECADVVTLLEEVVVESREKYPVADIVLTAPTYATVLAVPEFDRAMRELVENALLHNDQETPSVTVSVDTEGAATTVKIADNGPPIPETERKVVTGESPTTPTVHSQSLGLWFVHWVVGRSGGKLSFRGNSPRGSVVTVELFPRLHGGETVSPTPSTRLVPSQARSRRTACPCATPFGGEPEPRSERPKRPSTHQVRRCQFPKV
ncbi:MAG: PAS domain S-box protein [Halobacteriota archaeon]